jgi:hypothetical protein
LARGFDFSQAFPRQVVDNSAWLLRLAQFLEQRSVTAFDVVVDGQPLTIPYRIYSQEHVLRLIGFRSPEVVNCILTRHHDGFVRSRAIQEVLSINRPWSMPYILQLIGEYVIEILDQIDGEFDKIDPVVMKSFMRENPAFLHLIRQRVESYWDCYYRGIKRQDYVGFRLLNKLASIAKQADTQ